MPLVLYELADHAPFAATVQVEQPEVVEECECASAHYFQSLLAGAGITAGHVGDSAQRSVAESDGDEDVVVAAYARTRSHALCVHADGRCTGKERGQIDEMAHLTDDAAATYRRIVNPGLGWNWPGVHPVVHDER